MTTAYSIDLREKIVKAKLSGKHTIPQIAELFSVGIASVNKFYKQYMETDSLAPNKQSGRPPKILDSDKQLIEKYIADEPDSSLQDYCDMLESDTGKTTCVSNMHLILKNLKLTRKKKSVRTRTRS